MKWQDLQVANETERAKVATGWLLGEDGFQLASTYAQDASTEDETRL